MSLLTAALMSSALSAAQPTVTPQIAPPQISDDCLALFTFADESDAYDVTEEPEILAVVNGGNDRACRTRLAELRREGTATTNRVTAERRERSRARTEVDRQRIEEDDVDVETRTRRMQEEVTVREVVAVKGVVDVLTAAPSVEIEQAAANVTVREAAPQVTVSGGTPEILVREQAPVITMQMPTITIEQPAPIIEVVMPDPSVNVENPEPKVTVRQARPTVRVAVAEPRIDLDLSAAPADEAGGEIETRVRQGRSAPGERQGMDLVARNDEGAEANVYVRTPEPKVERVKSEETAKVRFDRDEPTIRFEAADPEVKIEGEPKVEFKRVGEPRVEFRSSAEAAETKVSSLRGKSVYGQNGQKMGEIGRVVQLGSSVYAVLEHGGVLGLGEKEVPLPLSSLSMKGNRLTADNMTKSQLEELSDQDIADDYDLTNNQVVRLRAGD